MEVLKLNASEEILDVISWKKAVTLYFAGKAIKPFGHEEFYKIPTPKGFYYLPTVIILKEYKKIPHNAAILSRKNLMKRDDFTCQYCDSKLNKSTCSIDHVIPRSRGGRHVWTNVVASCKRCNTYKGDRTPTEARMSLQRNPFTPTKKNLVLISILNNGRESWNRWIT